MLQLRGQANSKSPQVYFFFPSRDFLKNKLTSCAGFVVKLGLAGKMA